MKVNYKNIVKELDSVWMGCGAVQGELAMIDAQSEENLLLTKAFEMIDKALVILKHKAKE